MPITLHHTSEENAAAAKVLREMLRFLFSTPRIDFTKEMLARNRMRIRALIVAIRHLECSCPLCN